MTTYEELKRHRDFLLEHRWVQGPPGINEACLVVKEEELGGSLSLQAQEYIMQAISEIDPEGWSASKRSYVSKFARPVHWNDNICPGAGVAIEVLELAMRYAKEVEADITRVMEEP